RWFSRDALTIGVRLETRRWVRSAHEAEARPQLVHEERWLLERREVSAAVELVPVHDVPVALLGPGTRHRDDLLGKDAAAGRQADAAIAPALELLSEALPVEPGGGRRGIGEPVEHHVVEELVASEGVLGMAVAVGPCPELLQDPCGLSRRRVRESVAESLRP